MCIVVIFLPPPFAVLIWAKLCSPLFWFNKKQTKTCRLLIIFFLLCMSFRCVLLLKIYFLYLSWEFVFLHLFRIDFCCVVDFGTRSVSARYIYQRAHTFIFIKRYQRKRIRQTRNNLRKKNASFQEKIKKRQRAIDDEKIDQKTMHIHKKIYTRKRCVL